LNDFVLELVNIYSNDVSLMCIKQNFYLQVAYGQTRILFTTWRPGHRSGVCSQDAGWCRIKPGM